MHRSGTSMVAGCMKLLGIDTGRNLMPANEANPRGYWEENDVVAVHDLLLGELGLSWHSAGMLPEGWVDSAPAKRAKQQLCEILYTNFRGKKSIKDPENLCVLSTGYDPRIHLPPVPNLPDVPLELEMWVKVDSELTAVHAYWQKLNNDLVRSREAHESLAGSAEGKENLSKEIQMPLEEVNRQIAGQREEVNLLNQALTGLKAQADTLTALQEQLKQSIREHGQKLALHDLQTGQASEGLRGQITAVSHEVALLREEML
jgi:hypothetical protein